KRIPAWCDRVLYRDSRSISVAECSLECPVVQPAVGILKPGQMIDVSMHHEDVLTQEQSVDGVPQNWWTENTRDKEAVLVVNVTGTGTTDHRSHRVHVRHSFSFRSDSSDRRGTSRRSQSSNQQRSDVRD
ncbi:hypothetical protein B296_00059247, partial [Ensete ventricosum]